MASVINRHPGHGTGEERGTGRVHVVFTLREGESGVVQGGGAGAEEEGRDCVCEDGELEGGGKVLA